ncbi:TAXI family TRAP transporter solute-binding subunit [Effusibacillus lacus]|uniref:C4-dicarboxylate ABC transporter substrate-binding protein n=1 Tax=Effusibacillus lacus TaxID=1348429 RepID=A0A292YF43_9BACL|nr:TAXI family TRAP transporter solute-binding subunit [Effusibacillus lacus]TCS74562.1 hypothetical protein EDD64_11210 [Effusibacillus lacus]GAX88437.1 C4-dicarboxylate ABC transporter substrate-binding protein [Effusibacillus lacus]
MRKWLVLPVIFTLATSMFAGCSTQTQSGGENNSQSVKGELVNVATGTTGGVYYPLGNALAQLWTDKLGVKGSATSTAASQKNIELLEKKETEVAFSQNNVVTQAYKGEGQFKDRAQKDLRALTYLYPNVMHFVVRGDSRIKSIKDLEGKKIVPGAVGSGTEISTKEMIGEYGLDYTTKKNVKADFVGFSEAAELMKNNQADAAMIFGGLPTASVLDMATSFNVKLLSFEPDMIKKITEKYPWYFEYVIPANTYKGQTEEVHTLAVANVLLVRKDLSEELVYQLTKTLYENTDRLVIAHETAKAIKLETALKGLTIPLHPGAEKYYKEKGLDTSKTVKP